MGSLCEGCGKNNPTKWRRILVRHQGTSVPKGDPHLVNWLENMLDGLHKSNVMNALGKKWFAEPTWVDQLN